MNREASLAKLKTLEWEDLDWIEQKCRELKQNADGGRFYSDNGDATHRAEGGRALNNYFDDVLAKHHGFG